MPPPCAAIAGFGIRGPVAKRVLVRAVGPSLAAFGISGHVPNPRLGVRDANGTVVKANDDWGAGNDAAELRAVMNSVGAFPLADDSRDAALLMTLVPGNYSAVVDDAAGSSGTALIEVYEVP